MNVLYLHRNDLRLHDNEAFTKIPVSATSFLPIFVYDDDLYSRSSFGFSKIGEPRKHFINESVLSLKKNYNKIGSDLLIKKGKTLAIVKELVTQHNIQLMLLQRLAGTDEKTLERQLVNALEGKCEVVFLDFPLLYKSSNLPFSIGDLPAVFTAFRHNVEKKASVRREFITPKQLPIYPPNTLQTPDEIQSQLPEANFKTHPNAAFKLKGGENSALQHIEKYLFETEQVATYKHTRNELIGEAYSSKLSSYLAVGAVSPVYVYYQLKNFERTVVSNESTYWLYFELLWRDYFQLLMLKHGSALFKKQGIQNKKNTYIDSQKNIDAWVEGATGDAFIDANMRELAATGFMSNRGRQNVACYLCKVLKVDWRVGAAYFEQQLIDYDVSSNYGNWQYIAGVGNDPREDRMFNSAKQAAQYDPDHSYRRLWGAED